MRSLVPCSSCNRHVEAEATVCPFCGRSLTPRPDPRVCSGPCSGQGFPRMTRLAFAAAGATLLCASCLYRNGAAYGMMGGDEPDARAQSVDAGASTDAARDAGDAEK